MITEGKANRSGFGRFGLGAFLTALALALLVPAGAGFAKDSWDEFRSLLIETHSKYRKNVPAQSAKGQATIPQICALGMSINPSPLKPGDENVTAEARIPAAFRNLFARWDLSIRYNNTYPRIPYFNGNVFYYTFALDTQANSHTFIASAKDENGKYACTGAITVPAPGAFSVSVSGPLSVNQDKAATWTAAVTGGTPPYDYQFTWNQGEHDDYKGIDAKSVSLPHSYNSPGGHYINVKVEDGGDQIREAGLLISVIEPLSLQVHGPTTLREGQTGTWTAVASGGVLPYSLITVSYTDEKNFKQIYFVRCEDGSSTCTGKASFPEGRHELSAVVMDRFWNQVKKTLWVEVKQDTGCGIITDWTEADATAILPDQTHWSLNPPSDEKPYSLFLADGLWVEQTDYSWRRVFHVYSFAEPAQAHAKFTEIVKLDKDDDPRNIYPDDSPTLFSMVPGWQVSGEKGERARSFRLTKLYRENFIIRVSGWTTDNFDEASEPITDLRSNFLSIAGKAQTRIDAKCPQ